MIHKCKYFLRIILSRNVIRDFLFIGLQILHQSVLKKCVSKGQEKVNFKWKNVQKYTFGFTNKYLKIETFQYYF